MADSEIQVNVLKGDDLTSCQIDQLLELFDANYENANHAYFLKSFETMQWIALATTKGAMAGFAIGESKRTELPRMEGQQTVAMAGISCINSSFRRHGLFTKLALATLMQGDLIKPGQPFLFCGRMAHAITYRTMHNNSNNSVPSARQPISDWHKEVLLHLADLYNVKIDPKTSVVIGKGAPIGYPRISYEATDEEKVLFENVNRDRGDSLLAMSWKPDPPAGW